MKFQPLPQTKEDYTDDLISKGLAYALVTAIGAFVLMIS